jgi:hypothetical protein
LPRKLGEGVSLHLDDLGEIRGLGASKRTCSWSTGLASALPMTLMNRLFGDWTTRPYAVREWRASGLSGVTCVDLLAHFEDDLYDCRSGRGRLIFFNPGYLAAASRANVIALGETQQEAERLIQTVPARLRELSMRAAG